MEIKYDIKDVYERNHQFLLTGEINNIRINSVEGIFKPCTFDYGEGPIYNYWLYDTGKLYLCSPIDECEPSDGYDLDTGNEYLYYYEKLEISAEHKDVIESIEKQLPYIQEELKSFLSERKVESERFLEVASKSIHDIEVLEIIVHKDITTSHPASRPELLEDEFLDCMYSATHSIQTYRLAYLPSLHSIKNIDTGEVYPSSILDTVNEAIAECILVVGIDAGKALRKTIVHNILNITDKDDYLLHPRSLDTFIAWGKKVGLIPRKNQSTSETHHFT